MGRLQNRRSQSMLRYGYTRDAQGNLGVDPNNEYGQYQQMLRGEDQQSHQLARAQRASGWGAEGGGYLGAQQDELQHRQGGEQAQLGQAFSGELADISQQEQDAAYGRDAALYTNDQQAAERAIDQGNFNPADYSGIDVPYGDETAPKTAPAPKGRGHLLPMPNIHQRNRARLVRRAAARQRGRRR
jgi:hypothetical protein